MPLNKSTGNMYPFITHTWNTVKGKCPHGCAYCYMKKWGEQPPLRFDESELKTNLGEGRFIFVGSSCDMFAADIPYAWITYTLQRCNKNDNRYLFQTKNPRRLWMLQWELPPNSVCGTTIESDAYLAAMADSPAPRWRRDYMQKLSEAGFETMVTVEPIMRFTPALISFIKRIRPSWVNIGADSQGHNLPEPDPAKIRDLVAALSEFTEVKIKDNLKRLCPDLVAN